MTEKLEKVQGRSSVDERSKLPRRVDSSEHWWRFEINVERAGWDTMRGRALVIKLVLIVAGLVFLANVFAPYPPFSRFKRYNVSSDIVDGQIKWTKCGENMECGHLKVPLDYVNAMLGNATLSLARYNATSQTARIGTLLVNPGGPGGSGVAFLHRAAQSLSDILDGRYDIVSWDPRGVNGSTPQVQCFESQTEQDIFFANTHQEILPDSRNLSDPVGSAVWTAGMRLADTRNAVWVKKCHERVGENLKYISTTATVRDIDRIYRALEGDDVPINYWGFSYGTLIGSYLVNMFPTRIGKVVIDGVINPDLWANTPAYKLSKDFFVDIEQTLTNFYLACAEAGPDRCALASNTSTPASIASAMDIFVSELYDRPLPVPDARRPSALTSSMVKALMFAGMYRPREWPVLASQLASAMKGGAKDIVDLQLRQLTLDTTIPANTGASGYAIGCLDSPGFSDYERKQAFDLIVEETVRNAYKVYPHFLPTQGFPMCHHWPAGAAERFTGPFNHTLSNVILITGNTADPVTPLRFAMAVNQNLLDSSRLVIQDSSGHCSSSVTSLCTTKAIKAYFIDGVLPPNGLLCAPDEELFPYPPSSASDDIFWLSKKAQGLAADDLQLLQSARTLGQEVTRMSESKYLGGMI